MDSRAPRQLHSLPSMRGSSPPRGFVTRPRRRGRRLVLAGVLVVGAAVGWRATVDAPATHASEGAGAGANVRAAPAKAGSSEAADAAAAPHVEEPAPADVPPFAAVGDVVVSLPSTDVLLVGYHEASLPGVLAMDPIGTGASNSNTTRITLPPDDDSGPDYHVMSSRGRVHPPTSAVDVVMRDDDPVLAPVDGVVTQVRPYRLYGEHADTRIEIQPTADPDLRLVVIHVDDVRVDVGDRVTTSVTELAGTANRFPFSSHVDRYLDERWPHVHMEVKDPAEAVAAP